MILFFPEKILQGKWAILGSKMSHGCNSEYALRIVLKALQTQRGEEVYQNCSEQLGHLGCFGPRNGVLP